MALRTLARGWATGGAQADPRAGSGEPPPLAGPCHVPDPQQPVPLSLLQGLLLPAELLGRLRMEALPASHCLVLGRILEVLELSLLDRDVPHGAPSNKRHFCL